MAGWHQRLHGHEFELTSGVGGGQGGLALQRVGHGGAIQLNFPRRGEVMRNCRELPDQSGP